MTEKWTNTWPKKEGVYLFYGYAINKSVETFKRLHLVTVEYVSDVFGVQYRTSRHTIKKESGAYGMWKPIEIPDLPSVNEVGADKAARRMQPIKDIRFVE